MATVAATVADGGRRPVPGFLPGGAATTGSRAMSATVARTVRHLMIGVVRFGTGTSAAIPGVVVAGKTGTAELKSACPPPARESASPQSSSAESGGREANGEHCERSPHHRRLVRGLRPRSAPPDRRLRAARERRRGGNDRGAGGQAGARSRAAGRLTPRLGRRA
jgi:hypothetical protein